jgi:AmmeMemoRadiSam system protein B
MIDSFPHLLTNPARPEMKLVPLLVGNVSETSAAEYAEAFQEYWNDDETFWIISSDFCHW